MKNYILLLLLATFGMQAQTYQNPTFGTVKLKTNTESTTATKVNVQESDGTINWQFIKDFQNNKPYFSTGLLKNGLLTINADNTKFDLSAGIGVYSDFSDPENVTSKVFNFPAFTAVVSPYIATSNITYVAVNYNGGSPVLVMQASQFSNAQIRDLVVVGAVVHSNFTTINVINNISSPSNDVGNSVADLFNFLGARNQEGNVYSANGANLQLNKSVGVVLKYGANFHVNSKNPHNVALPEQLSLTFRYRLQGGFEGTDRINVDVDNYDLNNVLTAVPSNKYTIQTIFIPQTGQTRIQYGQTTYNTLADAIAAINTRKFNVETNLATQFVKVAYLVVKKGTTSLQSVADADIIQASKFDATASGGVAITYQSIIDALGYTPANDNDVVKLTGNQAKQGVLSFSNTGAGQSSGLSLSNSGTSATSRSIQVFNNSSSGAGIFIANNSTNIGLLLSSNSGGNNVEANIPTGNGLNYVGKNNGVNTFTVDKFGEIIASKFTRSGGTSSQFLKADGSIDNGVYLNESSKGVTIATLVDGKVPNNQIPALAISETFPASSQAQMLALTQAEQGDVAIRSDISKSYILRQSPSSVLANWSELLSPTDAVSSVNGQIGVVTLTTANINDTANKRYQTDAQQANNNATSPIQGQLDGKEPIISTKNTAFNKNFGTTAGTVAEGNDSRILNGQTAFGWGNHASAGYALSSSLGTNAYSSTPYLPLSGGTLSGALGIGTTNPLKKLVVSNNGNEGLEFGYGDNILEITGYNRATGTYRPINFDALQYNFLIGAATFSSSVTASGFFQSSDRRLKYIHKRDGDVAYFTWKDKSKGEGIKIGYIAQEVQKTHPDQVQMNEDGYLSVSYIEILVAKNRDLEKRLEALENRINQLEKAK